MHIKSTKVECKSQKKRKSEHITPDDTSELSFGSDPKPSLKKFKLNSQEGSLNENPGRTRITYSFLKSETYEAVECGGAGNCLFTSISYQLPSKKNTTHQSLRKRACKYMSQHISEFNHFLNGLINEETQESYLPKEYISEKSIDGVYGDDPEIFALSKELHLTIRVYEALYQENVLLGFILRSEYIERKSKNQILLHFIPCEYAPHYQAIQVKKAKENALPNSQINSQNKEKGPLKTLAKENLSQTSPFSKFQVNKRKTDQEYGLIKPSNNKYNEILAFFQSEEQQVVPKRLKNSSTKFSWKAKVLKKFKYDKELDRILELKKVSYEYLSDLFPKPQIKNSISQYDCFYYIPFDSEKQKILETAHTKYLHHGRDRMMQSIRNQGYNWYCLTKDCQDYISNCNSCPISTLQKIPSITTKQILEESPKIRYQIDTVLLAKDLQNESGKYLITIEDHFSKFLWAQTSKNKDSKSVLFAIKKFFTLCGKPKILHSDNGKEFVNNEVATYLKGINVEHICGRPYNPQCQGLIERANRTIQESLTRIYHNDPEHFDLELSLIDIIAEYNSATHSSTKLTPNHAFQLDNKSESDKELLNFAKENMKKSFKNKLTKVRYLADDKVLLYNAINKTKDGYLRKTNSKRKITKGFTIPAIVVTVESSYLSVKIYKKTTILNGDINDQEEYKITLNLVQRANEKRWNGVIKSIVCSKTS